MPLPLSAAEPFMLHITLIDGIDMKERVQIDVPGAHFRYDIPRASIERAAKALAESLNGGDWLTDYPIEQRDLWRRRVIAALQTA